VYTQTQLLGCVNKGIPEKTMYYGVFFVKIQTVLEGIVI